jgi:hypothetical protein
MMLAANSAYYIFLFRTDLTAMKQLFIVPPLDATDGASADNFTRIR